MREIIILSGARTPIAAFQGAFAGVSAPKLGAPAIKGALAKADVSPAEVTDCLEGKTALATGSNLRRLHTFDTGARLTAAR